MLDVAFKEWAVVCRALAGGRQALILRKGGIAEANGEFRPEHERFWLYPTFLHEHRDGVKRDALPLFDQALAERPDAGSVRLSHFAEVAAVHYSDQWPIIESLADLHIWSSKSARAKFDYRKPGLFVLAVRVFQAARSFDIAETPAYAGCKTWVKLEHGLPTDGAIAAIEDAAFESVLKRLKNGPA